MSEIETHTKWIGECCESIYRGIDQDAWYYNGDDERPCDRCGEVTESIAQVAFYSSPRAMVTDLFDRLETMAYSQGA